MVHPPTPLGLHPARALRGPAGIPADGGSGRVDDAALYIGAWLFDEDPAGIVVGQTLRDASLNDSDAFVVVLDTYLDRQNGFVFATTPAGIEYDGQVTGEGVGGGPGGGRPMLRRARPQTDGGGQWNNSA